MGIPKGSASHRGASAAIKPAAAPEAIELFINSLREMPDITLSLRVPSHAGAPVKSKVGAGLPVAVNVKLPAEPAVNVAPTALVMGAEGRGLHEQVRKHCDVLVRIPMAGKISSLNVSVAAGIVLFEWKRRYGPT